MTCVKRASTWNDSFKYTTGNSEPFWNVYVSTSDLNGPTSIICIVELEKTGKILVDEELLYRYLSLFSYELNWILTLAWPAVTPDNGQTISKKPLASVVPGIHEITPRESSTIS